MELAVSAKNSTRIARPLKELVSLIKQALQEGRSVAEVAAEQAARPFFQRAGESY